MSQFFPVAVDTNNSDTYLPNPPDPSGMVECQIFKFPNN